MIALFPTVSYALVIMVLYAVWSPLAKLLNDWGELHSFHELLLTNST
jgi:hypothetical protein